MMISRYFILTATVVVLFSWLTGCSQGQNSNKKKANSEEGLVLPDIPLVLNTPETRTNYLALHYWENCHFADTSLISGTDAAGQAFVNFIDLLPHTSPGVAEQAIKRLLDAAVKANNTTFAHFTGLAEKYLYDPNSPFRNEEYYIPFLQYIVSSGKVEDVDKIRPQYRLDMALKNRPGVVAADFTYTLANGKKGRLFAIKADFTILFFHNPDCHNCGQMKGYMDHSTVLNELVEKKPGKTTLAVLAVYPDADLSAWLKAPFPPGWISGYDAGKVITGNQLYDLKAMPTLYLLDKEKRVILKDAPIAAIEDWLK